jgi:3-methyladenine DNA glycosylase AlkD
MTERAVAQASAIERALSTGVSPERAAASRAYLKIDMEFTGASVPQARSAVVGWRRAQPGLTRSHLLAVAGCLWDRPVFECRMAAVIMLTDRKRLLESGDMDLVERMLRASGTWALVDGLAADVAGSLVARSPELGSTLDRWAGDANLWIRRSALLALLVPLRHGDPGPFPQFGRYADQMLAEKEFFIRKAIGWVLRETAKKQPGLVIEWLAPRARRASGVTMREAIRYLPPADAQRLMAAYRDGRPRGRRPLAKAGHATPAIAYRPFDAVSRMPDRPAGPARASPR